MPHNQIRYNRRRSETDPERDELFFLIINNDPREMKRLTRNIYELYAPIEEESHTLEGAVSIY